MSPDDLQSRLSRISTVWSMVLRMHHSRPDQRTEAHRVLMDRYHGAVYRYLLGAIKDSDAAEELFQEFAVRFIGGAFHRADPSRGRFRDYLKKALINLVLEYQKKNRSQARALETAEPSIPANDVEWDQQFVTSWRDELLARTWNALEQWQHAKGQPYYTLLRFRAEHPDASTLAMAEFLGREFQPARPFTEAAVRKMMQRARERFADMLIEEVSYSIQSPLLAEIEEELVEFNLLSYCRAALNRRRHA